MSSSTRQHKKISEIANIKSGKRLPKWFFVQDEKTNYPYIRVSDFWNDGTIDSSNIKYISKNIFEQISKYIITSQDLYISIAGTIGKTWIIPSSLNWANLTENAVRLVYKDKDNINNKYILYFTKTSSFAKQAWLATRAVAMPKLAITRLKEIQIPLPPLATQKAIVAKLDEAMESIDKSIALTEENITKCDEMWQTSLKNNLDNLEWDAKYIIDVAEKIQYWYTGKTQDSGTYRYLRITDIQNNKVNRNTVPFVEITDKEAQKYRLNKGDVIFARTWATVWKSFLIWDEWEWEVFASYLIRIIPNYNLLVPEYIKYFFRSDLYRDQIFADVVWAAQPNFNWKKLWNISFKVPSITEQRKAVDDLNAIHAQYLDIRSKYKKKIKYFEKLKSSTLHAAFTGKLVS